MIPLSWQNPEQYFTVQELIKNYYEGVAELREEKIKRMYKQSYQERLHRFQRSDK